MRKRRSRATRWRAAVVLTGVCLGVATPARAQGPLTGALPEEAPPAPLQVGPFHLRPTLNIPEVGVDTNVFDAPINPQRDYMLTVSPGLTAFVRSGVLQFVFTSGTDFTYYKEFESQRSIGRQMRGRLDFLFSRFRPTIAGALVDSRTRPNPEIDTRARRREQEVSGGLGYELSPIARLYVGAARVDTRFEEGEAYRTVALDEALNRRGEQAGGGARFALTPFTTLTLDTVFSRDRFVSSPARDSESFTASGMLTFNTAAIIAGTVKVGYRDFQPKDPTLNGYQGLVTTVNLSHTAFWRAKIVFTAERDVQYSFEEADGYYVGTGTFVSYTQRVLGPFDVQAQYGLASMDYSAVQMADQRTDRSFTYAGGVGYNRTDTSRFGVTYEYGERKSDERPDRRFTRRRLYGSLSFTF